MRSFRPRRVVFSGVLLLLASLLTATTLARTASTAQHGRAVWRPAPDPVVMTARYPFDGSGPAVWADATGNGHALTPVSGNSATPVLVPRGAGSAVRFPDRCRRAERAPCYRLVLRAANAPALNPAARPFRYGASVRLAPRSTSRGQNILQKGYSTEGSQYKLQVDGRSGHPSCALVSGPTIHLALARTTVADGGWHTLECRRPGTPLSVLVDGATQGRANVPDQLSITNERPLSLGGKSAFGDNDQFHGELDDAWVAIS